MPVAWEKLTELPVALAKLDATCWSLVRVSGRWPLTSHGLLGLPTKYTCPGCGMVEATVVHVLCFCPATLNHFCILKDIGVDCPDRMHVHAMLKYLFGAPQDSGTFAIVARYVSNCFKTVLLDS